MPEWPSPHNDNPAPNPADTLFTAIRGDAHDMFYAALAQVDDLNQSGGLFLRTAAQSRNKLFMKELVLNGADIPYAIDAAQREIRQLPRHHIYDDEDDGYIVRYSSRDEKRHRALTGIIDTLQQFQKHYTEHLLPMEILKNQRRILDDIRDLKREIAELRDGKPLEKTALPPPANLRKPPRP